MTDTVMGNVIAFLIPGYDFLPPGERLEKIELLSEYANRHLEASSAVAVNTDERPQEFIIGCTNLLGGQGHIGQLRTEAQTLANLGINTAEVRWWGASADSGGIPPGSIHSPAGEA
jgi:hypothetical protein